MVTRVDGEEGVVFYWTNGPRRIIHEYQEEYFITKPSRASERNIGICCVCGTGVGTDALPFQD